MYMTSCSADLQEACGFRFDASNMGLVKCKACAVHAVRHQRPSATELACLRSRRNSRPTLQSHYKRPSMLWHGNPCVAPGCFGECGNRGVCAVFSRRRLRSCRLKMPHEAAQHQRHAVCMSTQNQHATLPHFMLTGCRQRSAITSKNDTAPEIPARSPMAVLVRPTAA